MIRYSEVAAIFFKVIFEEKLVVSLENFTPMSLCHLIGALLLVPIS
jgi:hypothetical protein